MNKPDFKTPLKPRIFIKTNVHRSSHDLISPLNVAGLESIQSPRNQKLSDRGQEILKKWDFFSDPYSVPDKYKSKSPLTLKTEQTVDSNYDSIDYVVNQITSPKLSQVMQSHHRWKSERLNQASKQVKFKDCVSVKCINGEEIEKPLEVDQKLRIRRSKFAFKTDHQ